MILGIDLGTQGLKALFMDESFAPRAAAFAVYPTRYPRPGWAEQEPALWDQALRRAVAEVLVRAKAGPEEVKAIGITGQLDGCAGVDAEGKALTPCLIWMDRRAGLPLMSGLRERIRLRCGINPDPGHMAAKVRWLLDHAPESSRAACFHQPVSYLVSRLTGMSVFDHGLASTTMLYDLQRQDYGVDLLEAFGIAREKLPRIAPAESRAGELTKAGAELIGLLPGIPVAVGTGDDFASPLGAGILDPGSAVCVSGTAEVVGALSRIPAIDQKCLVETHCYPGNLFFIENPGWLSGGALEWFVAAFGLKDVEELDRRAAEVAAGADGVLFLAALSGSMAPEWNARARGCFYGLTSAHTTGHLARAVLEGCAFCMRDVVARLQELNVPAERIVLIGGGAKSALWARVRADVSGLMVYRAAYRDTAPIGAGMLAAVAAGFQPDLKACASLIKVDGEQIAPNMKVKPVYDAAYREYRRLFECLRPMWA